MLGMFRRISSGAGAIQAGARRNRMEGAAGFNLRHEAFGDSAGAVDFDFVVALLHLHWQVDFAQARVRRRTNSAFDSVRRPGRRYRRAAAESNHIPFNGRGKSFGEWSGGEWSGGEWPGDGQGVEIIEYFQA